MRVQGVFCEGRQHIRRTDAHPGEVALPQVWPRNGTYRWRGKWLTGFYGFFEKRQWRNARGKRTFLRRKKSGKKPRRRFAEAD